MAIRGRRQVGKSRLVQEFCNRSGAPYMYFTATKGASSTAAVASFLAELRDSSLPTEPALIPQEVAGGWPDAFRVLAASLPDVPAVVVIDELPWLAELDTVFDGALQTAWDRLLGPRPVLLLLLGSDIHVMERLTAYDRPFFGRADSLILGPLNPAEIGKALDVDADTAIDAHLITGGLPGVLRSWPSGMPALQFLQRECADPAAPVFGIPESALMAELPAPDQARRVLEAIAGGERTHATIAAVAGGRQGGIPSGSLSPILHRLTAQKRILARDEPLSTTPGKPALYRVADSNLRLYLGMGRAAGELSRRGRPEAAFRLIERRWSSWRGKAVEPLVREALEPAAAAGGLEWSRAEVVGGWWNRQFDPEVDLVGADRRPVAGHIDFVGSVKWLNTPFDAHDLAALHAGAGRVPGFEPGRSNLVVVSRVGVVNGIDQSTIRQVWGPDEILDAWV